MFARIAGIGLTSAAALAFAASPALAAGSNNGTLKIHEKGTAVATESNDPHVCTFNFEAFGLDKGQDGKIVIEGHAPTADRKSVTLNLPAANAAGYSETAYLTLPDGHYKVELLNKANNSPLTKAKSKTFWVECPAETPAPSTSTTPAPSQSSTTSTTPAPTTSAPTSAPVTSAPATSTPATSTPAETGTGTPTTSAPVETTETGTPTTSAPVETTATGTATSTATVPAGNDSSAPSQPSTGPKVSTDQVDGDNGLGLAAGGAAAGLAAVAGGLVLRRRFTN